MLKLLLKNNRSAFIAVFAALCLQLSASDFLTILPDAYSAGMGGVNNGIAHGTSALYLNPAGIAGASEWEFSVTHTFQQISGSEGSEEFLPQYEYVSFLFNADNHALGFSVSYYHYPSIRLDDADYAIFSGYAALTYAADFEFAQAGIRVKALGETVAMYSGLTYAVDAGIQVPFSFLKFYKGGTDNWRVGVSVYNIGNALQIADTPEELPANVQAGFRYTLFDGIAGTLHWAGDGKYFWGNSDGFRSVSFHTGAEYAIQGIAIRGGYHYEMALEDTASANAASQRFSAGLSGGIQFGALRLRFDYAMAMPLMESSRIENSLSIVLINTGFEEKKVD